jgi:hypothetical protein
MMILWLTSLLFSLSSLATPLSFIDPNLLDSAVRAHEDALTDENLKRTKNLSLDRFDLQFGVSASGDLGILTFAGGSAVEFIWQKNTDNGDLGDDIDEDEEILVDLSSYPKEDEIYTSLKENITHVFKKMTLKPRFEKRVLRLIRRDANRISKLVNDLMTMPNVGPWYVGGFFKNYSLGLSGGLIKIVNVGYSKRIRFRFKTPRKEYIDHDEQKLSLRQKKMKKLMQRYEQIRQTQTTHFFKLKRVWAIHTLSKGLDLGVIETSKSKGIQIEYKRKEMDTPLWLSESREKDFQLKPVAWLNNRVVNFFARRNYDDTPGKLSLHQIRMKYSFEKAGGFKIVEIGQENTFEFHYKR